MDIGICIASSGKSWQAAEQAEALGFSTVWFWDSPLICGDPFAAMAAAAMKTSKIRLGTAVYVPASRDPSVTASGFATLNALAPGRIELCAGTGFSGRRCYNLPAMTRKQFKTHMVQARSLLAGEIVEAQYGDKTREIRLVHPDRDLINLKDPIRFHVAAAGPKMMELTAELGMNWVNAQGPFGSIHDSAGAMDKTWAAAGREPSALRKTVTTSGCLLRDGEDFDSPRVKAVAGGSVAATLHLWADAEIMMGQDVSAMIPPGLQEAMDKYRELYKTLPKGQEHMYLHEGHCLFVRPDEEDIVTGDVIDQLSISGDAATMKKKLAQFEESGIDELMISVPVGEEHCLEDWANYFGL